MELRYTMYILSKMVVAITSTFDVVMVISGPPVVVGVTMFVLSISSLSEVKMVYAKKTYIWYCFTTYAYICIVGLEIFKLAKDVNLLHRTDNLFQLLLLIKFDCSNY